MYRNLVAGMAVVMILLGLGMLSFTLRHGFGAGVDCAACGSVCFGDCVAVPAL